MREEETGEKAGWMVEAVYRNAMASVAEFGRIAAGIYARALKEGLGPDEAKDVVEATLTAILRSAREGQRQ